VLFKIFDWFKSKKTWLLIKKELNMHMWHQQNDLNVIKHEWLRTLMYIILQQMMQQNLLYYLIIITLRSNHEINLIAFFYYMKCILKNCFAIVKHLNINVLDLLSDKEQNRIQEFAVFANKLIESEDEMILRMHHKIKQWWEKITKRELATDDFTHSVILAMFIKINSKKLKLRWMNQKCVTKDVCIFMSHISCENMKDFEEKRIMISTYYTAISKDDVNLKIQKCEMKNEIITALQDHWFSNATSCNLLNDKHEELLFRYFAMIEIREICIMLNALMSLQSWDSMKVLKEKELLFSQNLHQIQKMIKFYHNSSLTQMQRAYDRMRKMKIAIYESKLYFYCMKNEILLTKNDEW